jgi:hypothetical protein
VARCVLALSAFACKKPAVVATTPTLYLRNDANGDGRPDFAWSDSDSTVHMRLSAPARNSTTVRGAQEWRWSVAAASETRVTRIAFLGDLTGDRFAEFAVVEQSLTQETCAPARLHIFSGGSVGPDRAPRFTLSDNDALRRRMLPPDANVAQPSPTEPAQADGGSTEITAHFARIGHLLQPVEGAPGRWIVAVTESLQASASRPPPAPADNGTVSDISTYCGRDELWLMRGLEPSPSQRLVIETGAVTAFATGDLDGDSMTDLAVLVPPQIELYRGTATGFERSPSGRLHDPHDDPQRVSSLAIGDVNHDGRSELVVTFEYSPTHDGLARVGAIHYAPFAPNHDSKLLVIQSDTTLGEGRRALVLQNSTPFINTQRQWVMLSDPNTNSLYMYDGAGSGALLQPARVLRSPIGSEQFGSAVVTLSPTGPLVARAVNTQSGRVELWQVDHHTGALQQVAEPQLASTSPMLLASYNNRVAQQRPAIAAPTTSYGGCDVPNPREQVVIDENAPDLMQRALITALNSLAVVFTEHDAAVRDVTNADTRSESSRTDIVATLADCHRATLKHNCDQDSRVQLTVRAIDPTHAVISGVAWIGSSVADERACVSTLIGQTIESATPLYRPPSARRPTEPVISSSLTINLRRGSAQQ